MEGSARNEIDLENVESSQSDVITSNIRQFITLKHSVENSNRKVQYFKKEMSNLVESNRNIETNLNKLEKDVFDIEAKIEMTRKSHNEKKQELKDLESVKMNILRKQWNGCLSKIGNYSNDFCQWITKYSRDILMKDIENHQRECSKVGNELAILKQEVDDMRKKCGLNCTEINVDVDDDLLKFDSVISNIKSRTSKLMCDIRPTEDTFNKLQKKLKQYKTAVNKYKMKENRNMF